jgi:TolA-binding protein
MKNTRTLISSSIVSIIIMVLGMFMLCMSRAPKISFDEPLIEGGGVENDSVDVNDDDDFLNLLGEENNDMTLTDNTTESASDDDFMSLLNEGEETTTTYDQSTESGDEGLDEILNLLELDDNAGSENLSKNDDSETLSDSNDSDWLQSLTDAESTETTTETTTQSSESGSTEMGSIDQLSQEVEHLESVLAEKNRTAENLQAEINQYDQNVTQSQRQRTVSRGNKTVVQPTSYYEPTPANESSYSADTKVTRAYTGGGYDDSYNTALDLFQNHQYPQAVSAFYQLLQQDPKHPLADNCQYWVGECRYAQGKYYQAVAEFNKVFAYDAPDKQDDAQLMLGLTYLKLGEMGNARIEFDWLVSCYASSEYVNTAQRYLGQF